MKINTFVKFKTSTLENKKRNWYYTIITVLLVLLLVTTGCSLDGYKTFTAKNRLCHFSLEYPRAYSDRDGPTLDLNYVYYTVDFLVPPKGYQMVNPDPNAQDSGTVTVYHTPGFLHVFISESDGYTAESLIEKYLTVQARWANYNLLERSTILVSDISAEYAYFVSSSLLPMRPAPGEEIPLKHYRWVYFDYEGFIWQIELEYDGEMAEQATGDFEYVIQTFKILD